MPTLKDCLSKLDLGGKPSRFFNEAHKAGLLKEAGKIGDKAAVQKMIDGADKQIGSIETSKKFQSATADFYRSEIESIREYEKQMNALYGDNGLKMKETLKKAAPCVIQNG